MTIRPGTDWGTVGPVPPDCARVHGDVELHRLVDDCRRSGRLLPVVALLGGDLMRAVGGSGDERRLDHDVPLLPVDLLRVTLDDRTVWAAVHVVARRSWWRGPLVAAMNGQYLRNWDVAPRAHPNDGRVDLVQVADTMSLRDRWQARRRLPTGTHLPHPAIEVRRVTATTLDFARPIRVWIDGARAGTARRLSIEVEPDAYTVCV